MGLFGFKKKKSSKKVDSIDLKQFEACQKKRKQIMGGRPNAFLFTNYLKSNNKIGFFESYYDSPEGWMKARDNFGGSVYIDEGEFYGPYICNNSIFLERRFKIKKT